MTDDQTFQGVADSLLKDAKVTRVKMFGAPGLKVGGRVFTFLWKGRLVLKLPAQRVQALVDSGEAQLFDPGHGRVSKEWVSVGPGLKRDWLDLAREAKGFVAKGSSRGARRATTRR